MGDVNDDGYQDVFLGTRFSNMEVPVYLGSADGMDNVADIKFNFGTSYPFDVGFGDLDGDGINEIVYATAESFEQKYWVYKGTSSGWSAANIHKITIADYARGLIIADIDADGYDDIIGEIDDKLKIYMGGESLPSSPSITKTGLDGATGSAVAIGSGPSTRRYAGKLVTETITRPAAKQWDMLDLEGTMPKNTSVSITLLGGNGKSISGYKDMTDWNLDLSGLTYEQTIQVEIWIESEFNHSTPALDRLRVKWQDAGIWREQFYGPAKVNRLLGATVSDGHLLPVAGTTSAPDLLFASIRGDEGYSTLPAVLCDAGGLDYTSRQGVTFNVLGAAASAAADIDGDGYTDVAFAVHSTSDGVYAAQSPVFMGTPVGWRVNPDVTFPTTGARDVLLRDLNGDGQVDIVFAQERDAQGYNVNSTLHWGTQGGWGNSPVVEFVTTGATGVEAFDADNDGDLDLVFSCYKSTSTETESMVFLQGSEGFTGAEPSTRMMTKGATAVATGDMDGDGNADIVFTNSFHAGSASLPSTVHWGRGDGTFEATPTLLPTHGALDVEAADLDGDGDLDLVFANHLDNSMDHSIDSYVYLNGGSRSFGDSPAFYLPTVGASGVAITDLDGTGWKDIVVANMWDGASYDFPSLVYLGGEDGYGTIADLLLPTVGATDVLAAPIVPRDTAGYLSQRIAPPAPEEVGAFHTLRYTARVQGDWTGTIALVDASTWATLARTTVQEGTNDWIVADTFDFRDHTAVRVMVTATGLDGDGDLWLDDLWLNWTSRVHLAPVVAAIAASEASLLRTQGTTLSIDVNDEFTSKEALILTIEHKLEGTEEWTSEMLGNPVFKDGAWTVPFRPAKDTVLGSYIFRAQARDSDGLLSTNFEGEFVIEVLNNEPTAPEVRITPTRPVTTATMRIEMVRGAQDVEAKVLTYTYRWFRDGVPVPDITGDTVPFAMTSRGENWTVEVCAFDGDVEGPAAYAWKVIQNAPPMPRDPLPDPTINEDTQDSEWLDLSQAFEDPDGDAIAWSLLVDPSHVAVTIDHATGRVTMVPEENWNGEEEVTFVASDGELQATQTVKVIVRPVNDLPRFVTVDGQPVDDDSELHYSLAQGELLVIRFVVVDVEGHALEYFLNTSLVQLDEGAGEMRFQPDNGAVGSLRFYLRINDLVSPSEKVSLGFVIDIENANDPMDEPKIGRPLDGDTYRVNQTFSLIATCYDPDLEYGQVLNYTWTSDLEGLLGHGSSLTVALVTPGTHTIIVTVTDGEYERSAPVTVVIEVEDGSIIDPADNDQGGDDGPVSAGTSPAGLIIVVLAVVSAIGGAAFVMVKRRASDEDEDSSGTEDHELSEDERREVLRALAGAVGEAADSIENGKDGKDSKDGKDDKDDINGTPDDLGTTSQGTAPVEVRADVDGLETSSITVPKTTLSIQAKVTESAPDEVMALFKDAPIEEAPVAIPDAHELRLEALKRKYQDAIAHMPYGIPSKELKGWDWTKLACALATGPKRTVDGDKEVTQVDGRWYYSDPEEPTSFLKEHGAKAKATGKGTNGKSDLLAKLEERFIIGDISEEAYLELREKYSN